MEFKEKIVHIQKSMKVPKNLYNNFGKYHYRNAETILETAKPICSEFGVLLTVSDEIVSVGDKNYIKATAKLYDVDSDASVETHGFAREADTKKGMDDSQITGACSSYARKYALNGLFCLDDTKDADTNEFASMSQSKQQADNDQFGQILIRVSKMQNEMSDLGIDWRENYNEWILNKSKSHTQDLSDTNLTQEELISLGKVYQVLIKKMKEKK